MVDPIEKVRDQIAELHDQIFGTRVTPRKTLEASFESVSDILEESQHFFEELHKRNEELIKARQELELNRRRYQELFEFAPDAYLVTDPNGVITEANREAARMLAIRQDYLVGKPLRIFIVPEARPYFSHLINSQSGSNQVEIPLQPRNGTRILTEVTMMMVPGVGGKAKTLRWALRDVSEREKEHQALLASENRFHTIFLDAPMGIQLVGLDGTIIESNRAFQEMTGYSAAYIRGRDVSELVHPEDQTRYSRILKEFSVGNTNFTRLELRYPSIDGEMVMARVNISLLRDLQNLPANTIHMIDDITQEKRAAAELAEMKRKLMEGIEAERLRLAQDLHDGPMQDLYAVLFKLSADEPIEEDNSVKSEEPSTHPALSSPIEREHLTEAQLMIKQVATTLRAICGELRPPTLGNLGLEKAIRSHIDRTMSQRLEINVHLALADDNKLLSSEQRIALFRVYQQGITNVLRHARARDIWVLLAINEGKAELEIRDNGRGFELPERLVELTREGHYGLAGIAERVEMLGGKMEIQTAPGAGTQVRVMLPI